MLESMLFHRVSRSRRLICLIAALVAHSRLLVIGYAHPKLKCRVSLMLRCETRRSFPCFIYEKLMICISNEDQLLSSSGNAFTKRSGRPTNRRLLAHLSPRLGILNNIPFAIPFETRVEIFRQFVCKDLITVAGSTSRFARSVLSSRSRVTVRRGHVAEDGFDKLGSVNLKGLVEIQFIDQFGNPE